MRPLMMNIIDINSKNKGMTKAEALQAIAEACELEVQKPARFLAAWKRGIKLAGGHYFKLQISIDKATQLEQLQPDYDLIRNSLRAISTGQAQLLALMYSFYDDTKGQEMLKAIERPSIRDAAYYLDSERLQVIIELMQNYHGW